MLKVFKLQFLKLKSAFGKATAWLRYVLLKKQNTAIDSSEKLSQTGKQMSNFDDAFAHVIGVEGDYSNHEDDRGGPTKYGITQDTLSSYRGKSVSVNDVKNLQITEAKLIYRSRYWNPISGDSIKSNLVATIIFDQAVNRGVSTAAQSIQAILGVKVDGVIGPKTIEALNNSSPKTTAFKFICEAQEHYARIVQRNNSQAVFLVGWLRRSHKLLELVLSA
jgi:lysozyme family protein